MIRRGRFGARRSAVYIVGRVLIVNFNGGASLPSLDKSSCGDRNSRVNSPVCIWIRRCKQRSERRTGKEGGRARKRGNEAGREARARRDLLPISFSRNSRAARTASTKRFRSFDIPNPPWLVLVLFDRPSVAFVAALKRRVFALSRSDVAN